MKVPFKFKGSHSCEAVVFSCIDFRFWEGIAQYVKEELGISSFDFPSLPGASRAINKCESDSDAALSCINIACDLHQVKKIIIVDHADCGAYGGSAKFGGDREAEQRFHKAELKKAGDKLRAKYPNKEIILVYASLDEPREHIEFVRT